ncbi:hypothetical protein CHS0354_009938 [Potamilus streckersoni]|uniref:Hexosyltransferase n=1 Tax=Potamilus streckersoni TaxID=2493646 RepID=A0AAE0TE33_9BIVA|nr:hypothetical protein CHS0354_009938 [Potamilus streckersoni]
MTISKAVLIGFNVPLIGYVEMRLKFLSIAVGICLGITVYMMLVPFLEQDCEGNMIMNRMSPRRVKEPALRTVSSNLQSKDEISKKTTRKVVIDSEEDFEPRIVKPPDIKPGMANKTIVQKKISRPRYISTELGIREKVFVAILTNADTLNTFGIAINRTLVSHVTKTIFFTSTMPSPVPPGMNIVSFGDKHNEYLPVHTLRYISEHYGDTFDFYLFVSDRTYLRGHRIFEMVEHISINEEVYMGAPSTDGKFCDIEGGVIFSQPVISKVLKNLDWCLRNTHPDNPSITLGMCVTQSTQKHCSMRGGDQIFHHYRLDDFEYDDDIIKLREDPDFNNSLSLYPLPDDISQYKLHRYFCLLEVNLTRQQIEKAKEEIIDLSQHGPKGRDSLTWPIGVPEPFKPTNRYSVIPWVFFTETHMYLDGELSSIKELKGLDKLDIQDAIQAAVEKLQKTYDSDLAFHQLINGYRRYDQTRGMEYVLDLMMTNKAKKNENILKRVHLVRPVGKVENIPMPYVTENTAINMVVVLHEEDVDMFDKFMVEYAQTCMEAKDNSQLIVALVYPNSYGNEKKKDPFAKPKALIDQFSKKYNTDTKVNFKVIQSEEAYMNDVKVLDLLIPEFADEALIMVGRANMELTTDVLVSYLNRVRMNTIKGWQVFFPIGFAQYKPGIIYKDKSAPLLVEIGSKVGHYDLQSYDHMSFYVSDYKAARKLMSPDAVNISSLFTMFLNYKKVHIFRAVEPFLKLRWIQLSCLPTMPQHYYQHCITRNAEGLASTHDLAMLIFQDRKEVITQPIIEPPMPKRN